MKFKKVLSLVLACMMVVSLAACGGSKKETSTNDSSDTNTSSDAVLQVGIWDSNQEPGLKEIMAGFTAETGIEVEVAVTGWTDYWTMLSAAAQGGALPDVFWMHANESVRYMSNDILLDLTEQISASEVVKTENYPTDIWDLYSYDEKNYAVPKDVDTIALWYNKTMFKEAGLEYPTADWTWEDLCEAAIALTKDDGSQYGFAMSCDDFQSGYGNWIYANDGSMINYDPLTSGFDSENTIEAMELLESLIRSGAMPSQDIVSENSPNVLLESGKLAMTTQGSWMLAEFRDNEYTAKNCDIVELPKSSKTGKRASIYNGLGWAAAANTEYPEEAWKLIEYLGSEAAQLKQAELGITMSAYNGTSDAWVNGADFNLQAYLNMRENMYIFPHSKNTAIWNEAINNTFKAVWMGEMTMRDGCLKAAEQMNEVLAEE